MLFGVEGFCALDIQCRFLNDRLKGWSGCPFRDEECCRGHDTAIVVLSREKQEFIKERIVEPGDWKGQARALLLWMSLEYAPLCSLTR